MNFIVQQSSWFDFSTVRYMLCIIFVSDFIIIYFKSYSNKHRYQNNQKRNQVPCPAPVLYIF